MNKAQEDFLLKHLQGPGSPEAKIIRLAVEQYILVAEAEKKELHGKLEVEVHKNKEIKGLAEQLARELLRLSPGHQLAEEVLALLLESKMRSGDSSVPKRKRR